MNVPVMILLAVLLPILLVFVSVVITPRVSRSEGALSPFECGFNPISSARSAFSIQFFLIGLVFLVFDVEVVLLLPYPLADWNNLSIPISSLVVIIILLLGLVYEWITGSLQWLR